jgi:hypothetical protein
MNDAPSFPADLNIARIEILGELFFDGPGRR